MAERVSGRAESRRVTRPRSIAEESRGATDRARQTPGHPQSEGTLPMARLLTAPDVEEWIQRVAASAPPMSEDQRSRLSRLFRLSRTGGSRSPV